MQILKRVIHQALRLMNRKLVYVPRNTVWGSDLEEDLRSLISGKTPVCLDVGANTGQTIKFLQRIFDKPVIHAFEPSTSTFQILQSRRFAPSVNLWNCGVGRETGALTFNEYPSHDLSSFLKLSNNAENRFRGAQEKPVSDIPVISLDDFIAEQNLLRVDLLKSDTQGYDLRVLQGASRALKSGRIQNILVELNFVDLYQGQDSATEIVEFLAARGFGLIDLYGKERSGHAIQWCNALFTLKNARETRT